MLTSIPTAILSTAARSSLAILYVALVTMVSSEGFTHGGKKHGNHESVAPKQESAPAETNEIAARNASAQIETYRQINEAYLSQVKSIYRQKCFDCHSQSTKYPAYYKLPGAKQLIDHDIAEARSHLDFSQDYPFKGHGTSKEDLEALRDVTIDGSMPPLRYRLMHKGSALTEAEKNAVLAWVEFSLESLDKLGRGENGGAN